MVDVTTFAQALLGSKGVLFWLVTAAAALATVIIFAINTRSRDAVDAALREAANGHAAIGIFELCGPGASNAIHDKALVAPERLWCYDEAYLDTFVEVAAKSTTSFGDRAAKVRQAYARLERRGFRHRAVPLQRIGSSRHRAVSVVPALEQLSDAHFRFNGRMLRRCRRGGRLEAPDHPRQWSAGRSHRCCVGERADAG